MKDKLTRGAGWLAATRVLINLIGFASTLLLARLLVPADFGLVAIATTVAAIVASVTELSMGSALVQHDNPQRVHFDSAWTLSLVRSVLVGIVIAALTIPITHFYGDPRLMPLLLVIGVTGIIGGGINPKLIMFTRSLVFRQEFILGVSQKLLGFIVAVFVAYVWRSYWALVASVAAGQLLTLILSYALLPYRPRFSFAAGRELLSFSIWLLFGQIVQTLNYRLDTLFIGYFLGNGPLGYYNFGDNLAVLPTREATAPIAQTLFPAFTQMRGDQARLRHAYMRAQMLLAAVALPLGCGFALIAHPLVTAILGEKWQPAVIIIQVLASVFAIQTLATTLQPLAMAMGETRTLFWRDAVNLTLRIPLMIAGLVFDGLQGIVFARLISGLLATAINMALVRKLLDLRISDQVGANRRSISAVCLMAIVIAIAQYVLPLPAIEGMQLLRLVGIIVLGALTYAGTAYSAWVRSGRPDGPEYEIRTFVVNLRTRVEARSCQGQI
jgi:O-antigen/teichoic acid export membrane protein